MSEETKQEQTQEQTQKTQEVDVEKIIEQALNEKAKYLGFESWDDLQVKILEEKGKLYEALEQERKKLREFEKTYKEQIRQLQKEKEELLIESVLKQKLSKAIDIEKAMKLLRTEKHIEVKNNKILINGNENIDEEIEKFFEENPFLLRAAGGSGTPHRTETEVKTKEDMLREALKKLLGGER